MIKLEEEAPGSNEIFIHPDFFERGTGVIRVRGTNNRLTLKQPHAIYGFSLTVSGENEVFIDEYITFNDGQSYNLLALGSLKIGRWTSFNARMLINIHEPSNVTIGRDCLFASDVTISTSPVHKILDKTTGERLNPAASISIADHVWVSARASLFGGADIGKDSVVGHSTYVSKAFPDSSVIAGSPAKVIRSNVTWEA